ncbi:hypothetical protein MMC12_007788 [Toensbergia leucococca]|nr:hypothetical protein [Toensbergia leucococca]
MHLANIQSRVILPLLGDYTDSGFRTPKDRILYSLRSNGRYQLIVLGCASAGLLYVFFQNGFEGTSVKALVMALAYCWGLILAIYLMGHGLVAVPRRLYRNANLGGRLQRIQGQAPKVETRLTDAISELDELEVQVTQLKLRKNGISRDHQEWIEDLEEVANTPDSRANSAPTSRVHGATIPAVITDRYLAELTRKLNRARHKRVRFIDTWDRLIQDAVDTQATIDASASKQLNFGKASPHASLLARFTILTPYTRYLLYSRVVPSIRIGLAGIFATASVCIVWSELIKFVAPQLSIISLTVIRHSSDGHGEIGFLGQIVSSLWILYMCTAALASFEDVKVWGNRAIVRRNTYGESACWYAGQIAKLTVPLSYNFVTFLPRDVHRETTFYHFLGRLINLTPLGKGFDYFFPIFILVPVCATYFNLYGRVKNIFGFGGLEDEDEENPSGFGTGGWREGRDLIQRELNNPSSGGLTSHPGRTSSPLPPSQSRSVGSESQRSMGQPSSTSNASSLAPRSHATIAGNTDLVDRQAQRLAAATQAAEEEDENFFQGFAHRMRNTLDGVERPEWFSDLSKRPKWMGGVDGNSENSGRAEAGRGMGRWFGGRPSDGRVRL